MRKLCNNILAICFFSLYAMFSLADGNTEAMTTVEAVKTEVASQTETSRRHIIEEAVDALSRTRRAVDALEEGRNDDALDALATAVGKLELVIARDPELALAPTSMSVATRDVYGSKAAVQEAIAAAKRLLADGNVQGARQILRDLGSEVVISLTNLPLATYPDAIKAISPLIDDGKTEEARIALQAALNTLVVTEQVVPLPILRAQSLLTVAEALADQDALTPEQEDVLKASTAAIREQAELAELLGYGVKRDYSQVYRRLSQLESRLEDKQPSTKLFAETRAALESLWPI